MSSGIFFRAMGSSCLILTTKMALTVPFCTIVPISTLSPAIGSEKSYIVLVSVDLNIFCDWGCSDSMAWEILEALAAIDAKSSSSSSAFATWFTDNQEAEVMAADAMCRKERRSAGTLASSEVLLDDAYEEFGTDNADTSCSVARKDIRNLILSSKIRRSKQFYSTRHERLNMQNSNV